MASQELLDLAGLAYFKSKLQTLEGRISNCVTHIPQTVNLTLTSGTLTLKAGSSVFVPNGADVFDEVDIASDVVFHSGTIGTATGDFYIGCTDTGALGYVVPRSSVYSGASNPGSGWSVWFDTSNNVVMYSAGADGTWSSGFSLPVGVYVRTSGVATSIRHRFNGIGFCGKCQFVLPGVAILAPNGRNDDGSLKSLSYQTTTVLVSQYNGTASLVGDFWLNAQTGIAGFQVSSSQHYDEAENLFYTGTSLIRATIVARAVFTNGYVTDFFQTSAFHAVDWSESPIVAGWSAPSSKYIDLTLGASGTIYTAPANGWFFISRTGVSSGRYVSLVNKSGSELRTLYRTPATNDAIYLYLPAKRGDSVVVSYSADGSIEFFRFVFAEGEI